MDIKKQIQLQGKTLTEVAIELGKSLQNLSSQVNHNPTIGLLEDIAKVCGCSVSELLREDNDAPKEITITTNGQSHTYIIKDN